MRFELERRLGGELRRVGVQDGTFPPSVRSYGLTDGTIGNTNYTIIPYNSPHKAAAMVLANVLLTPISRCSPPGSSISPSSSPFTSPSPRR